MFQVLILVWDGEAFSLAVGVFLLTVELLCLQSIQVFIGSAFPLLVKKENFNCK